MLRQNMLVFMAILTAPMAAQGQGLTQLSQSRGDLFQSQLGTLDDRAAARYSNAVGLGAPRAIIPGTPQALAQPGFAASPYLLPARAAADAHAIPRDLFLRLISYESDWNPRAVSPKGAIGLAQLMPETARALRVDARSPTDNLNGGARYLRMMFDRFGSWRLALAAYNAGPAAVEKYRDIPPFAETQQYVRNILPLRVRPP